MSTSSPGLYSLNIGTALARASCSRRSAFSLCFRRDDARAPSSIGTKDDIANGRRMARRERFVAPASDPKVDALTPLAPETSARREFLPPAYSAEGIWLSVIDIGTSEADVSCVKPPAPPRACVASTQPGRARCEPATPTPMSHRVSVVPAGGPTRGNTGCAQRGRAAG